VPHVAVLNRLTVQFHLWARSRAGELLADAGIRGVLLTSRALEQRLRRELRPGADD
jgi:hypothetical protein